MLTDEQFHRIKHKKNPTMADVALLIITVEQLVKRNIDQGEELKRALGSLEKLNKRLAWYHKHTVKSVS